MFCIKFFQRNRSYYPPSSSSRLQQIVIAVSINADGSRGTVTDAGANDVGKVLLEATNSTEADAVVYCIIVA
jgi:hypothetical protein